MTPTNPLLESAALFQTTFERPAAFVARAPGRVNLIGEHTDYNDGFVLPAAIERETFIAAAPRADAMVSLVALDLGRCDEFDLNDITRSAREPWSNYVRGVAAGLRSAGYPLRGLDAVIHGNVPIGAGLSSSAAMQIAAVQAFSAAAGFEVPPETAARIAQKAEHEYVGTRSGLMDQLASALGQAGHALLIDCRDLSTMPVRAPSNAAILIADTAVRRSLASSAYNERRAQCEAAAQAMDVSSLRDATIEMLEATPLAEVICRRARHVITENGRVTETVIALRRGDLAGVGALMDASHASLRDLYEVSSPELDSMVALLRAQPGCWGARLTGAGFGGCAVALIDPAGVADAIAQVGELYRRRTGRTPALYATLAARGACVTML